MSVDQPGAHCVVLSLPLLQGLLPLDPRQAGRRYCRRCYARSTRHSGGYFVLLSWVFL